MLVDVYTSVKVHILDVYTSISQVYVHVSNRTSSNSRRKEFTRGMRGISQNWREGQSVRSERTRIRRILWASLQNPLKLTWNGNSLNACSSLWLLWLTCNNSGVSPVGLALFMQAALGWGKGGYFILRFFKDYPTGEKEFPKRKRYTQK